MFGPMMGSGGGPSLVDRLKNMPFLTASLAAVLQRTMKVYDLPCGRVDVDSLSISEVGAPASPRQSSPRR
jgi:hypothetical protein